MSNFLNCKFCKNETNSLIKCYSCNDVICEQCQELHHFKVEFKTKEIVDVCRDCVELKFRGHKDVKDIWNYPK